MTPSIDNQQLAPSLQLSIRKLEHYLNFLFNSEYSLEVLISRIKVTLRNLPPNEQKAFIQDTHKAFELVAYYGFPSIYYLINALDEFTLIELKALSYYMVQLIDQKKRIVKKILEMNTHIDLILADKFGTGEFFLEDKIEEYKQLIKEFFKIHNVSYLDTELENYLDQLRSDNLILNGKLDIKDGLRYVILRLIGVTRPVDGINLQEYLEGAFIMPVKGDLSQLSVFCDGRNVICLPNVHLDTEFYNKVNNERKNLVEDRYLGFKEWIELIKQT